MQTNIHFLTLPINQGELKATTFIVGLLKSLKIAGTDEPGANVTGSPL